MYKMLLTDEEAQHLIEILKHVIKKYNISLHPGSKGYVELDTEGKEEFYLHYFVSNKVNRKMSLHLRQKTTNINLIRINIDPNGFHKNSDNTYIYGDRLLIYSQTEWFEKADGKTYLKAYKVPKQFTNLGNLEQVFLDFLFYINVKRENKLAFENKIM